MRLSIAIITKNRKYELCRAINSCIECKIEDMEFIIVDNNSSDGTQEYITNNVASKEIFLTYFYSDSNLGVAGGRNKAMELAKGEYVFFLDDDAFIDSSDLLNTICDYLDKNVLVGAIALRIYDEFTQGFLLGPLISGATGEASKTLQFLGGAHVLRKSVFGQDILYPSKLGYGSEELYASLRIWNRGYSIHYLSNVLIRHIPSLSNRLEERERQYNVLANIYIVKMLTYPFFFRALSKCIFCVRLIKNGFFDSKSIARLKKDMSVRYRTQEVDTIGYSRVIELGRTFGWRNIV